jgi:hypothetical protein
MIMMAAGLHTDTLQGMISSAVSAVAHRCRTELEEEEKEEEEDDEKKAPSSLPPLPPSNPGPPPGCVPRWCADLCRRRLSPNNGIGGHSDAADDKDDDNDEPPPTAAAVSG